MGSSELSNGINSLISLFVFLPIPMMVLLILFVLITIFAIVNIVKYIRKRKTSNLVGAIVLGILFILSCAFIVMLAMLNITIPHM